MHEARGSGSTAHAISRLNKATKLQLIFQRKFSSNCIFPDLCKPRVYPVKNNLLSIKGNLSDFPCGLISKFNIQTDVENASPETIFRACYETLPELRNPEDSTHRGNPLRWREKRHLTVFMSVYLCTMTLPDRNRGTHWATGSFTLTIRNKRSQLCADIGPADQIDKWPYDL